MARRKTLSTSVADHIIRQIQNGRYRPGDSLPTLKDLAAEQDVGYGVAREAMQQLVALGFVDVRPRKGATVRELSTSGGLSDARLAMILSDQAVDELYDLRAVVEVAIAGQAAMYATEAQIEGIRSAQRVFAAALRAGRPHHMADIDLHASIAQASNNTLFLRVLEALRGVLSEIRAQAGVVPGSGDVAQQEHAAIVDAIVDRDAAAAREAMSRHLDTAKQTMHHARTITFES